MLTAGARFGPYEIVSPLGAGGMGEVYRARDTTLHRLVAIKVLPDSFARDPERIARFEREARTLASLNDPNIAAIFGFENEGGRHALVLELVEGPTLADRISRGPLLVPEALAVARQIARALDAAHQRGIVHRDLKPANVKVREDGTVKVLDFGLSKAFEADGAADVSSTPTITSPAVLTGAGVIIGSAAYMAPEQAKGMAADKRADIWAFGCVLYEMLTGRRAFDGAGVTETLAAVLRGEPDWAMLPPDVPAATRTLLTRCLEKDRGERVQDISTARFVLAEQGSLSGSQTVAAASLGPARRSRRGWWVTAAAAAGVLAGAAAVAMLRPGAVTASGRTARFELAASQSPSFDASAPGMMVALSPDGARAVYPAVRDGVSQLMLRPLDRLEARPIAGTEGGIEPFFSPDGEQIGFVVAGELKRVSVQGGRSTTIWHGDPTFGGAAWGSDGTIVFSQNFGLHRINESGGEPVTVASPDDTRGETSYIRPVILPGGVILYTVILRGGGNRIAARRLAGGDEIPVLKDGFGGHYLPPGYLVYAANDRIMAVAFDLQTLRASGAPVELETNAFTSPALGVSNLVTAANGSAVFVSGRNNTSVGRVVLVDREGRHLSRVIDQPLEEPRALSISPDGRRMALAVGPGGQGDLWVYDLDGSGRSKKLTFRDHNTFPVWSPDGRQIVYMTVVASKRDNYLIASDGSSVQPRALTTGGTGGPPMDWSPLDGTIVIYYAMTLHLLHPPDWKQEEWHHTPFSEFGARFTPDGHLVAYGSTQNGAADVWVRPFPSGGVPVRVSTESGAHNPTWSRDGKELYYIVGPKLMAARLLSAGAEPRFEAPRLLFSGGFVYDTSDLVIRFYDTTPDGRFLMVEPVESARAAVVLTQHWADEIQARLTK